MAAAWEKRKLNGLAHMCLGKMLDQKKNKGKFLPYLANLNVRWGAIDIDSLREMRFEEREFDRYGLKYGDIVMCEGGEPGRCAIWKNHTSSMMIQKALHRIRAKEGIDSLFLYYALFNKGINGHYAGFFTGAAIKHLTGESLAKIEVDVPPLPIQEKIAGILAAYDDLIENNLNRIKLLEEMAQITYEEWFVRMRFPGYESTPINPTTGLPEGWEQGTMGDLYDYKNGFAFKGDTYITDGKYKIVTIKNVQDGWFVPVTTDAIAELPSNIKIHHHLSTGNIIMSLTGNVGRICLVFGENYLLNQRVAKIEPVNKKDHLYVYTLLRSKGTLTQLENISNGAAQQNLSPINASKLPALIPTRSILDDFHRQFGSIIDLISLINIENQSLREARDILLPRLMTGVIDVENYNPADLLKEVA